MPEARILVVDDHEDNRVLLKMVLESHGLGYLGAQDGQAGLQAARRDLPDLMLLDLEMPQMDGFGVLEALRADRATADLPVIILTATYMEPASVERGLSLGADEYLVKPINPEELLVRIRSVIRARRAEREVARLRRDFQSMLVHDLRSPLEGIGLALDILLKQEVPPDQANEVIALARDQVRSLSEMVSGLLEYYRADAGGSAVLAPIDLVKLAEEVNAEASLVAQDRRLLLTLDAPESLLVEGDHRLLKRVLANLVANALKFTPKGVVRVSLRAQPPGARIEVCDSGPGIPADERAKVFDTFYHIARRRERPEHGFGLGLAFCKAAVEEHGGTIGVTDSPSGGATFWIELPALPASVPAGC